MPKGTTVGIIGQNGTGFHPEFTGRDNVYMYGPIIGLSKDTVEIIKCEKD